MEHNYHAECLIIILMECACYGLFRICFGSYNSTSLPHSSLSDATLATWGGSTAPSDTNSLASQPSALNDSMDLTMLGVGGTVCMCLLSSACVCVCACMQRRHACGLVLNDVGVYMVM